MNQVVTLEPPQTTVAVSDTKVLMNIIERAALSTDFDVAKLQQLLDLRERWEAGNARKAFTAAMAAFKSNPPEILKDKRVSYSTSKGQTEYTHATLGGICRAAIKGLSEHGLSHRWDVKQTEGRIQVTCIITHEQGHSESVSLNSPADESGGKNSIQAIGSTITYLQRYSLLSAAGLAAEEDDDGQRSEPAQFITDKQALDLQAKAEEVGANRENFLKFLKVERLADLPASRYNAALQALKDKATGAK